MAEKILAYLLPGFADMGELVRKAYAGKFETEELAPLVRVGQDYVLELFRGPTSAFKDVALSMLPRLISAGRRQTGQRGDTVILTATSGETGKAALEGFHDVEGTRIFVFYPAGGVSDIQQLQMTTQPGNNVCVCAVRGNFDDCQTRVKQAFSALRQNQALQARGFAFSSANSINIGRLAPQVSYYFAAYARLLERGRIKLGDRVDFTVPTGNFGDILAGWMAGRLGLPVGRLICASNANRVLTDFFETGVYDRRRDFYKTESPSMDILVSSNLERMLFYVSGGDTALVRRSMEELGEKGFYPFPAALMQKLREQFDAGCCSETETRETIGRIWRERGYLCDPHTAVGFRVAGEYRRANGSETPLVVLSTASAYKFPDTVMRALGRPVEGEFEAMDALYALTGAPVPPVLAALRQKTIRHSDVIDAGDIQRYVLEDFIDGGKR
jgi:threonine synthase